MKPTKLTVKARLARRPRFIAFRNVSMYGEEWMIHGNGRKLTGRETRDAVAALNVYWDGVNFGEKDGGK